MNHNNFYASKICSGFRTKMFNEYGMRNDKMNSEKEDILEKILQMYTGCIDYNKPLTMWISKSYES